MTKEFEDRGNTYTIHESKDIVEVRVLSLDIERSRISLSMILW